MLAAVEKSTEYSTHFPVSVISINFSMAAPPPSNLNKALVTTEDQILIFIRLNWLRSAGDAKSPSPKQKSDIPSLTNLPTKSLSLTASFAGFATGPSKVNPFMAFHVILAEPPSKSS